MADCYADADPEEFLTVVGVGPMTLRTAVRGYVAAREKAPAPASFDPGDLDRLAEMERCR